MILHICTLYCQDCRGLPEIVHIIIHGIEDYYNTAAVYCESFIGTRDSKAVPIVIGKQ